MSHEGVQKLHLIRGGQYGRPGARKAIEAERLMRERFYALGPGRDQVVKNIATGRTSPTRKVRHLLARLKARNVAREAAWSAVIEPMQREFVNVYGATGEHTPAA